MGRHLTPTFSQDLAAVLAGPLIHQLADDLAGMFPRRRRHPVALLLGYLALQRAIGSANRLDAELAVGEVWHRAVGLYNAAAHLHGDHTIGVHLSPPTADTFRHIRDRLTHPDHLPALAAAFTTRAVETAIAIGLLPDRGGSRTHPSPLRTLYGDGTIIRPLYRHDNPGRADPDIALHHRHDGTWWGNNLVLTYCRGPRPHRRVILGIDRVHQPGREADTAVGLFSRIVEIAGDRAQAIVYDGALRGTHHNQLMHTTGCLVLTKVHAAARRDGTKIARTIPLTTRHHHPDAAPCSHTLVIHDGAIHDSSIDSHGQLQLGEPLDRHQVRRYRTRTGYRFSLGIHIACPREPFTAWISPHPHADQLRLLPETDPDFAALYGLRNDAESNNNSYKATLPSRRAAALGWRRQLLDAIGWAILINSRAYARHGPSQPRSLLEPTSPDPLGTLLTGTADHQRRPSTATAAPSPRAGSALIAWLARLLAAHPPSRPRKTSRRVTDHRPPADTSRRVSGHDVARSDERRAP